MAREDRKRNFALREADGTESSVFTGNAPRQAALKAARRLEDVGASEAQADRHEIKLREKGTDKVHIYDAWAWKSNSPDNNPDWMPDTITKANVSKKRTNHLQS